RVLDKANRFVLLRSSTHDRPADRGIVSVKILRSAVDYQIGSKLKGALVVRRQEGIVYSMQQAACSGYLRNGVNVSILQGGIGRRFGQDEPGILLYAPAHRFGIGCVCKSELNAKASKDLGA